MTYRPHGQHLVAGRRTASSQQFDSRPVTGPAHSFCNGGADEVDSAVRAAEAAFASYGQSSREQRAAFLAANHAADAQQRPPLLCESASLFR